MKPIQPIMSDVVAKLVRSAPLSAEKVLFAWRMAVGAMLARVTAVRLRSDGCLLVHLQDERWRPELQRAAAVVRARMAAVLGDDVLREVCLVGAPQAAVRRSRGDRQPPTRPQTAPTTRKRRTR